MNVYVAIEKVSNHFKILGIFSTEDEAKYHVLHNYMELDKIMESSRGGEAMSIHKNEMLAIMSSHIKRENWNKLFDMVNKMRFSSIVILPAKIMSDKIKVSE